MTASQMPPNNWTMVRLGEVGEWGSGGTPKRTNPEYYGGDIPWLKIGDLTDGPVRSAETHITDVGLNNSSAKLLEPDMVLVAMYGSIGKLGITKIECATNQAIAFCRHYPELVSRDFLFYGLMYLRQALKRLGRGGTQQNISQTLLKQVAFPLPPLNEQHRIIEKVKMLFSELDQGEATLRKAQALLARYRQSLLKAAVTGELTADWRATNSGPSESGPEILARILDVRRDRWQGRGKYMEPFCPDITELPELPARWVWTSVDAIGVVTKLAGFEFTKFVVYDAAGDLPVIKAENVASKTYDVGKMSYVAASKVSHLTRSELMGGELLMVFVGANLGRVSVAPRGQKFFLGPNVALIRLADDFCSPDYLETYFDSDFGYRMALNLSVGAAQGSISMGRIRQIPVPLPPRDEQNEIVEGIRQIEFQISHLESLVKTELARSAALRQSILKEAFAGRLVPQDPNDEPASALLARIRAGRKAAPKKTTRRKTNK